MSRVRNLLVGGMSVFAAMAATPAGAVALTFDLTTKSTLIAGVTGGLTFGSTTTSDSTQVTATAWNAVQSSTNTSRYTITQERIGAFSGGLGVTSTDDYDGNYNLHQIDNAGDLDGPTSVDFVLLTFTRAVTLSSISRQAYGLPNPSNLSTMAYDNDYTVGYGATRASLTQSTAAALPFATLNNFFGQTCQTFTTGTCSDTDSDLGAGAIASTTWIVAASFLSNYGGDHKIDGFKLASIKVNYTPPTNPPPNNQTAVPEPATWAQMILGFGLAGAAVRRRRRAATA